MDWEGFYNRFREKDFVPGYEIGRRLGGGAFGEVYLAKKTSIDKAYAIKFLKVDDEAQADAVRRELEQVRNFASIDHPNLVSIEDLGTVLDVPYVIMGYAGEDTLARRLREGELDREGALRTFVQVCRGVLALHDRRLVHFDLKPSNVFLKGEVARVGDYGLSRLMSEGRQTLSFGRGTPQYMAPEMLRGRADHRADVYSLGVLLYECLTGRLPFESEIPGAVVLRESDDPPPLPADLAPSVAAAVERCLRLRPEDRYPGIAELLIDLGQTPRPGDSIRLEFPAGAARPAAGSSAWSEPAGAEAGAARSTAAELTRGAVEVARGVWDGLRSAARPGRASASASSTQSTPITPSTPSAPWAGNARPTPPPTPLPTVHPRPTPRPVASAPRGEPTPLAVHTLSSSSASASAAVTLERPGGAATIPVPPSAAGGFFRTLATSLALGLEVLMSLGRAGIASLPGGLLRFAGSLWRGAGGLLGRVLRLALFVLLLALIGAALTTFVLFLLTGLEL